MTGARAATALRSATAADRDGIRRVLQALHPEGADSVSLPEVRQEAETFVAVDGGEVVGVAVATFVDYGNAPYGVVEELVVNPAIRGTGIGTRLLAECRRWLDRLGAEVVFVSAVSDEVVGFYLSAGFTRCTGPWLFWAPEAAGT